MRTDSETNFRKIKKFSKKIFKANSKEALNLAIKDGYIFKAKLTIIVL